MGDPVIVMALFASEDAARHAVEEKDLAAVLFETSTPRGEALRNSLHDEGVALTDIVAIDVRSLDHRYASWVDGGLFHERDLK